MGACDRCGRVVMVELLTPQVGDCCEENKGVELGLRGVVMVGLGAVVEVSEVRLVASDLVWGIDRSDDDGWRLLEAGMLPLV